MEISGNQIGTDNINKSVFFDDSSQMVQTLRSVAYLGATSAAQ